MCVCVCVCVKNSGYFTKNHNPACTASSLILKRLFWILIEKIYCHTLNSTVENNKLFSILLKHI